MNVLDTLLASTGEWRGVNRLWTSPAESPIESTSVVHVVSVLNGRFVRIDQAWAYGGKPQAGSLLVGCDPATSSASIHWIDTFHMGFKVMACAGAADGAGGIDALGTYAAPPGSNWGWRIRIGGKAPDQLVLLMDNIDPDGRQELAVEAKYSRLAAGG